MVAEGPGIMIPDNVQPGVERSLSVSGSGQLDNIEVELDITHTYIGDLVIELISPDSTAVLLHHRTGGSSENIIKTYTLLNTPALQVMRGGPVKGAWSLRVSDHAGLDRGKLNRWGLRLTVG